MNKDTLSSLASMIGSVSVDSTGRNSNQRRRGPTLAKSATRQALEAAVDDLPDDDFTKTVADSINAWAAMHHSRSQGDASRLDDIDAQNTRLIMANYDADPFVSVTACVREKGITKHDDVIAKRIMLVMTYQQRAIQAEIDGATSSGSLDH